jgi:hypothetical protein
VTRGSGIQFRVAFFILSTSVSEMNTFWFLLCKQTQDNGKKKFSLSSSSSSLASYIEHTTLSQQINNSSRDEAA